MCWHRPRSPAVTRSIRQWLTDMLRVTKLTDYATVLLACLAKAPHAVHSASDLAEQAKLEQE